jgi:hypothetical protein
MSKTGVGWMGLEMPAICLRRSLHRCLHSLDTCCRQSSCLPVAYHCCTTLVMATSIAQHVLVVAVLCVEGC